MPGIPQDQRDELVDRNFGVSPSASRYAALVTANGTDTTNGAEVSGAGYARKVMTFTAASNGATENTALVSWTASGGDYGTVVGVEVWTAVTGGARVYWAPLDTPRLVEDTDTLEIAAGAVDYSFNG